MIKQKARPAKQENQRNFGKFYVAKVDSKSGRRFEESNISTSSDAIRIAKEKDGGGIHAYAYEWENGEYKQIYPEKSEAD